MGILPGLCLPEGVLRWVLYRVMPPRGGPEVGITSHICSHRGPEVGITSPICLPGYPRWVYLSRICLPGTLCRWVALPDPMLYRHPVVMYRRRVHYPG